MGTANGQAALIALRAGAALFIFSGLGVGVTTPLVLAHLVVHGDLPISPFGFRFLAGPFEALGRDAFILLGLGLTLVSTVDVIAGTLLWRSRRSGVGVGLVTSPLVFVLGWGFAVPFLLITAPLRVVLALAGRGRLR